MHSVENTPVKEENNDLGVEIEQEQEALGEVDAEKQLLGEIELGFDGEDCGPLSNPEAARSVSEAIDGAMKSICGEPPIVNVSFHVTQERKLSERTWFTRKKSVSGETVKVKIDVIGTDLSFGQLSSKRSHRKSRRVPSYEALKSMAEKHRKQTSATGSSAVRTCTSPSSRREVGPLSPNLGHMALYLYKKTPPPTWEKSGLTPQTNEDGGVGPGPLLL